MGKQGVINTCISSCLHLHLHASASAFASYMWTMFQNRNHLRNHYGYEMKIRQITAVIRHSKQKKSKLRFYNGMDLFRYFSDLLATAKVTNHKNYNFLDCDL